MKWPVDLIPNSSSLELFYPSQEFKSEFTGVTQSVSMPGAHWKLEMKFSGLTDDEARQIEVITDSLRGNTESMQVLDHARLGVVAKGNPVLTKVAQGTQAVSGGWNASTTVLKAGDLVTINGELKRIKQDIKTSASGVATLHFNPPLRKPAPAQAAVITLNPYMTAHLEKNSVKFSRKPMSTDVSLKFIEAIYK